MLVPSIKKGREETIALNDVHLDAPSNEPSSLMQVKEICIQGVLLVCYERKQRGPFVLKI